MSIPAPTFLADFAQVRDSLDPRMSFTRATTGSFTDRLGVLKHAPAGAPRWTWNTASGVAQGMSLEASATNLALYSEDFSNAAWTKTNASIGSNAVAAPDGATTADSITVSAASGSANQAVTITAGNSVSISVYFKQFTSAYGRIRITDGTNSVAAWFNIAAGTVGTASAGLTTCVYSAHSMRQLANGWYRCQLTVTTATSTAFTVHVSCAASDNTEPANLDSVYAWGVQIEQVTGSTSAASSYVPTTSATVTRNGDVLVVPTSTSWFSATEGTMLIEWVYRPMRESSAVLGGIGDTFSNTIYLNRSGSLLYMTVLSGGPEQALMAKTMPAVDGVIARAIMAWKVNDFAFCLNGGTVSTDTSGAVPVAPVRLGIGNAPYSGSGGTQAGLPIRRVAYWPWRLANAALQTLTQ